MSTLPPRHMIPLWGVQDPVSSLVHLGAAVSLLVLSGVHLRQSRRDAPLRRAAWLYLCSVVAMFFSSGVYHLLPDETAEREVMRHLDHASIWLAITGTLAYTAAVHCSGWPRRRAVVGTMWAMALVGATLEVVLLSGLPPWLSPLLYIGIGWVGLPILLEVRRRHGVRVAGPLLLAGLAASFGGLVDSLEQPVLIPQVFEAHEITHVAVVVGAGLFWWMNWRLRPELAPGPSSTSLEPAGVSVRR